MIEKETRMYPKALCSAFGRVFYGAQGRVYFSQVVIDGFEAIGRCYQRNDPIHEDMPDVLDTDGGEIQIPEAGNCIHLEPFKEGVLIFCDNGIWYLKGTADSGFTATSYIQSKVSHVVLHAKRSVVPVKDELMFASASGLYRVQSSNGALGIFKFSELRIDSFLKDFLSEDIHSVFDENNDKVFFIKPGVEGRVLVYDAKLDAFFPWKLSVSPVADSPGIIGTINDERSRKVYFGIGVYVPGQGIPVGFMEQGTSYTDLNGAEYNSYIVTQENTVQQYSKNKGVPLVEVFMKRTENSVVGVSDTGLVFDRPSSCKFSTVFNFGAETSSLPRDIYRALPYGFTVPDVPYDITNKPSVVRFVDKVRGVGRSVKFKFESDTDKEMCLLGFSVQYSLKTR